MANLEHLETLKQGVKAWNKWRVENSRIIPDLEGADLREVDLRRADLCRAHLRQANLYGANLAGMQAGEANLAGANLSRTDLNGANLRGANLHATVLNGADLNNLDLKRAWVGSTVFGDNDLSTVKGLETVQHFGPSTVGIDTIYRSKGEIPEAFLRGVGVPEEFMRSLAGKALDFYSCFISYSSKDDDFAQRLYADLQEKNVRCWKFDANAKWGEPLWGEIETAIRKNDKLVVICSEHSLQSPAVLREIECALQKEDREHTNVLFPICIDDYVLDRWDHPCKARVVGKVIGNFRGSDNHETYSKAFSCLLGALNRPQPVSKNRQA